MVVPHDDTNCNTFLSRVSLLQPNAYDSAVALHESLRGHLNSIPLQESEPVALTFVVDEFSLNSEHFVEHLAQEGSY